jgi:predicted Zn-dependent protease
MVVDSVERLYAPIESLTVSVGGFDDDTLFLSWQHKNVEHSLVIADAASQRALSQIAPPALLPKLIVGRKQLVYHRSKWQAVLATLGVVALAIGLAWWQSDAIIGWIADHISVETEERLGRTMLAQLEAEGDLLKEGLAVDTVKSIGAKITSGSRYKYQWFVKQDSTINAFAVPSGIVVVTSELIAKAASAEELAGVLAHEAQHVEQRHSLKQMIHTAGWAAILTVALGDVSAISAIFVHQIGTLRHSRQLETEADSAGTRALVRAGISPSGLHTFFKTLMSEEKNKGGTLDVALLSTHPATEERLANIDQLIKSLPCACQPLNYDWSAVQASLQE